MSLQLPREPRTGQPLDPAWGAQLIRYLRSITPRSSATVKVNATANGTFFAAARLRPTPKTHYPFEVTVADDMVVAVALGFVNGMMPTLDGETLLNDPSPTLAVTGHGEVVLKIVADAIGSISEADILFFGTGDTPDDEWAVDVGGTGYLVLARITLNEAENAIEAVDQIVRQNLAYAPAYGHLFTGY